MGIITDVLSTILLLLYGLLGQNVVLAIIAFTVIIRAGLMPLTMKQQSSMKRMQELQPKLKKLQTKYKDDREKLVQEQMALYKEHGVNPFAGCLPLIIQLPIFFGLWRAIIATLASSPRQLLELQDRIMIGGLDHLVPLKNTFLWLNLALPDQYYILPILVVITTYVQQKLIMPATPKPKPGEKPEPADQAAQMTRSMTTYMPLLFGFLALSYSSGLSIYFITANIFGVIQYSAMGKADFRRLIGKESPPKEEENADLELDASVDDNGHITIDGELVTEAAMAGPQRHLKAGFSEMQLSGSNKRQKAERSSSSDKRSKKKSKSRSKR
jgi:YidC/Oxa1 family membrane protein insertase